MRFFDDTMPKKAAHARALFLALLRDRRPGDEAYPPLEEAAGYYLRLNPNDAEMREAWDGFVDHPPPAQKCAHNGFLLVLGAR